jgi:hypothetical protein
MIVYSYLASTHGRHNTVSNIHNTYAILQDISYALMTGAYTAITAETSYISSRLAYRKPIRNKYRVNR